MKEVQGYSFFWPMDINRISGDLGLLNSSRLSSQCWFKQSRMMGMRTLNCMKRSFFYVDEDDNEDGYADVDVNEGIWLVGVCDDMKEAEENVHHVNDGADAMDAVI